MNGHILRQTQFSVNSTAAKDIANISMDVKEVLSRNPRQTVPVDSIYTSDANAKWKSVGKFSGTVESLQ
jgi:hypothetical protein